MRIVLPVIALSLLVGACAADRVPLPDIIPAAQSEPEGELRVEIRNPVDGLALTGWESAVRVEGGASVFGGVRYLELMLALDSSKSLKHTDPKDYRSKGALGLIEALPDWSAVRIGVVDFDSRARLVQGLTENLADAASAIRRLDKDGKTDLAAGILTALEELDRSARPDSSRVILLFTDGKSDQEEALAAMREARSRGVAVHTLLLGDSGKGAEMLAEIARGTRGSFVRVLDPSKLPEAFLGLRTTGVDRVELSVNGGPPLRAHLVGGTFAETIPVRLGRNRIVARATSLDGDVREAAVDLTVSGPLSLQIDSPVDGVTITHRESEVHVEGRVDAFAELPLSIVPDHERLGLKSVVLRYGNEPPFLARVVDGRFEGRLRIHEGENRIRAVATTLDGRTASDAVTLQLRAPGCAELEVAAYRDGEPALAVSERAVEVVVDGSNSMWGRMNGQPKMSIAKDVLLETLGWMQGDVRLALRAYGHRQAREAQDCTDTELLVGFGSQNRASIRDAIAQMKPKGVTPLAYSLEQVAADFTDFRGERAVVLVTDGIESCGGDPRRAARVLGERGIPVHVIGFGLGNAVDEDVASLEAIADASGGRFILARSAKELRDALATAVGTAFRVEREGEVVARGALGSGESISLPEGLYDVHLESQPAQQAEVTLRSEQGTTIAWERKGSSLSHTLRRRSTDYTACWDDPPTLPASLRR